VLELVVSSTVVVVVVVVVEVGSTVVEVVGATVVVVGRTVEVVEVVAGLSRAAAAGRTRGRGRVVVGGPGEPAPPPAGRRRSDLPPGDEPLGVAVGDRRVTNPSRLPPPAPSSTATTSVAHRRSMLNRPNAPTRLPTR
jgi:hypothetical protein